MAFVNQPQPEPIVGLRFFVIGGKFIEHVAAFVFLRSAAEISDAAATCDASWDVYHVALSS